MKPATIILALTAITVGVVAWLQHSLVLVHAAGSNLHWLVVLVAVPVVQGLIAAMVSPRPYLHSLAASVLAAGALYGLYAKVFWKQPPSELMVIGVFGTLTLMSGFGVTLARGIKPPKVKMKKGAVKQMLLVGYHLLAIAAAVVTIIGFLRQG